MSGQPRLVIVGIDGMSYGLLRAWMEAGHLPRFGEFARRASWSPLRCTWPPHTAAGWPSLFHGRLPGEHGLFQFWDCQAPDYQLRVLSREEAGTPSLWDVFHQHGWDQGLLYLPMSHPPGPWRGYQITWPLVPTLRYVQPPELARELSTVGGHTRPDIACMYDGSEDYPERARGFVRGRVRAVRHLLQQRPVDVLAVVISELDRVCHHYWHAADPAHPRHAEAGPRDKDVILRICVEIDRAFGEILEGIEGDCPVLVVSDHGFGPGYRGLRLHHLLADGGFCTFDHSQPDVHDPVEPDRELEISGTLPELVWEETLAYVPCPGSFGVNLNLKGRQRRGAIEPADRERALRDVAAYLRELSDPEGEGPLFSAVVPGEQAYAGPFAHRAPDLLLVPADPSLMVLCDLRGGAWTRDGQTGLHRMEGVFMLAAGGVPSGERDRPMAVEAVAGELLDVLGIESHDIPRHPPSAHLDALRAAGLPATAWSETLDPSPVLPLAGGPVTAEAAAAPTGPEHEPVPPGDEEIRQRLRQMGYL
ncbi:MAG: hypothetical protein GY856_13190 [bacterium]|nr:hypothetical protein [bacterium]